MITEDKVIEIFCVIDEFCKNFDAEMNKNLLKGLPSSDGKCHRNRKGQLAASEIMTNHHLLPFRLVHQFQALLPLLYTSASVRLFS